MLLFSIYFVVIWLLARLRPIREQLLLLSEELLLLLKISTVASIEFPHKVSLSTVSLGAVRFVVGGLPRCTSPLPNQYKHQHYQSTKIPRHPMTRFRLSQYGRSPVVTLNCTSADAPG